VDRGPFRVDEQRRGDPDIDNSSDSSGIEQTQVRLSHYTPWTGGTNCSQFVNGRCQSRMASGQRWEDWIGRAAACVPEWPFWTVFVLDDREWVCLDRGSAIVYGSDGIPYVDLLVEEPPYPFGSVVEVYR